MEECLLTIFLLFLSSPTLCSAKTLRDLSAEDFNNLEKPNSESPSFVVVYFDKKEARQKHPKFLKEYRKSSDYLEAYDIELTRVDCDSLSVEPCSELSVYIYRNGEFDESVQMDTLFNFDSIVGNVLQAYLKNELPYIYDKTYADEILKESRQQKNVVFAYVKGFGMKEHRKLLEVAFVYGDRPDITFTLTTDASVAKQIPGLSVKGGSSLAVHMCKDVGHDANSECRVVPYNQNLRIVPLAQFLEMLWLPKVIHLPKDGKTVYDNATISVNKLYIFSDESTVPIDTEQVNGMAGELKGATGIIIVDVNEHKDKLAKFGLSENTNFPTAAYVPSSSTKDDKKNIELFPEKTVEFSMVHLRYWVSQLMEKPNVGYKELASGSSLQVMKLSDFKEVLYAKDSHLFTAGYLLVAFCEVGNANTGCVDFAKHFRRLVRTFDREYDTVITSVYVRLIDDDLERKEFEKLPVVRLFASKSPDKFTNLGGQPEYDTMLDFIRKHTTMTSLTRLPPSNVDAVAIKSPGDKNRAESSEGSSTESSEGGDESTPPEEEEDDEVAGAVWYSSPPNVPEDKVPSLTDKTFNPTRDQHDLLVVNFFQPWDPRSRALVGPYVDAALSLGEIDVGDYDVQLARVNCFDWTDVCQNNNITKYPTIKLYRKGSDELIYGGPLDADHLIRVVLILQRSSPLHLESQDQIDAFLKGELPRNAAKATNVAILGVFPTEKSPEFKAFRMSAEKLRGRFLLAYTTGETASTAEKSYGVKLPAILVIKRNDPVRPRAVFDRDFTEAAIIAFVRLTNLQSYGELTPINLPLYHKHRRPLLIEFRASAQEDDIISPVMQQLAEDSSLPAVFLCWMALSSNDVNGVILVSYTGSKSVPVLVLVDHSKATVYQFKTTVTYRGVIEWVTRCLSDEQKPSSKLRDSKWSPLLEGYDYLAMIDREEEEKKKKKNTDSDGFTEAGPAVEAEQENVAAKKRDRLRQRKPEDYRKKEEKEAHDEL